MPYCCDHYNSCRSTCQCTCSTCYVQELKEDRTLTTLQNTNTDLKHLIFKLEHLSDSIDSDISQRSHISRRQEHNKPSRSSQNITFLTKKWMKVMKPYITFKTNENVINVK